VGIYDRDYYRQERPRLGFGPPQSAVLVLIVLNVAIYLLDGLFTGQDHQIDGLLAVRVGTLTHPLFWWQFLTYGFVHAPSPAHIIGNMLGLWFLGRDVEDLYGRAEFYRLYVAMVVVGGVVWAAVNRIDGAPDGVTMIGASGGVAGVVVLYALNFPRRTLLLFFVIPMPAWVAGVALVGWDIMGAMGHGERNIAYAAHLGGAALAFLYHQRRWSFGKLLPGRLRWPQWPRRGPRIHQPEADDRREDNALHEAEVDRILEKIHREGEGSLTRKERRVLELASREYQDRRRGKPQ
jgi:membrane associated rhomboid family serine protease